MLINCKECMKEMSSDVKKCPSCGKDQRKWIMRHKVLTFICGVIVLIVLSNLGDSDKSKPVANTTTQEVKPTEIPPIIISAEDLARAFDDNEIKANSLYKDKVAQVSGKIKSIGESFGSTYIVLSSEKDFAITDIQCFFNDKTEISKIANLNKGDVVTIKGTVDGKSMNVSVRRCIFVNNK